MIKNNLSKILGEKRIKMSELQKLTGLGKTTVIRLYHDRTTNIDFNTLNKLCEALDCTTQELLEYIPD